MLFIILTRQVNMRWMFALLLNRIGQKEYGFTLLIFFHLGCLFQSFGQLLPKNLHFDKVELPTASAINIAEDNQGYIWVGSTSGLFRYNGLKVEAFLPNARDPHSVSTSYISKIYASRQGGLWVVPIRAGLDYFDPNTNRFKHWKHNPEDSTSLPINELFRVFESKEEEVWLTTWRKGIIRFNPKKQTFKHWVAQDDAVVKPQSYNVMSEDSQGRVWFGGFSDSIIVYQPEKEQFINASSLYSCLAVLPAGVVKSLTQVKNGNIWIVVENNLYYLNTKENLLKPIEKINQIGLEGYGDVMVDDKGRLWISSSKGLIMYHPDIDEVQQWQHNPAIPFSIPGNYITNPIQSKQGMVFMLYPNGILKVDPLSFAFHQEALPIVEGLPNDNNIHSMASSSDGKVWLAGSGSVFEYNPDTYKFSNPQALQKKLNRNYVRQICTDDSENLYVFQEVNMLYYEPEKQATTKLTDIYKNKDGEPLEPHAYFSQLLTPDNLWLGSWGLGIVKVDRKTQTYKRLKWQSGQSGTITDTLYRSSSVVHIAERPDGKLWVCAYEGLFLLDPVANTIAFFKSVESDTTTLSNSNPHVTYIDSKGRTWVGADNALNLYHPETQTFTRYSKEYGITQGIFSIEEDSEGKLWMGGSRGIICFDPEMKKATDFEIDEGVASNHILGGFQSKDGRLFFSGTDGFTHFHPDDVEQNRYAPSVIITELTLFNQPVRDSTILPQSVSVAKEIVLAHEQYVFGFEFVVLNYRQASKNQYKYKLEGFSDKWIETDASNPRATFTDLDAGTYTFIVKAANDDGVWNENATSIKVIVLPPWYLTWWAKTIWILLAVGGLLAFYFNRISSLKKRQLELEHQVQARTLDISNQKEEILQQAEELKVINEKLEALSQFKEDMGNMVAHDFKAPLNSIIWYGKENEEVSHAAQRMKNLLENFLDVHKFEQAELQAELSPQSVSGLVNQALKQTKAFVSAKSIQVSTDIPQQLMVNADQDLIIRVLENLLSNATKFTPTQGNIFVKAKEYSKGIVRFEIQDTGRGISKDKLGMLFDKYAQVDLRDSGEIRSTGLGLAFCKMAVDAHGGEIWVESEENKGSSFYFTLSQVEIDTIEGNIHNTKNDIISLSEAEKNVITPYLEELKQLDDTQLASIRKILKQIETDSERIVEWKDALVKACFANNLERYRELLKEAGT